MKAISILSGAMGEKPLKRLLFGASEFTGLKPGANDTRAGESEIATAKVILPVFRFSLAPGFSPVLSWDGDNQAVSTAFRH